MPLVAPSRSLSLDVIRGFAILGILLANISAFAAPVLPEMLFQMPGWTFFAPYQDALVAGKFRGILALMLGVGLWIQYQQLEKKGIDPSKPLFRRYGILIALGLCHGFLIWWGDILATYGVSAILAIAFIKLPDHSLRKLLIWGGIVGGAFMLGLMAVSGLSGGLSELKGADGDKIFTSLLEGERWAFSQGGLLPQFGYRFGLYSLMLIQLIFLLPEFAYIMLFGVYLARRGVLTAPSEHPKLVRKLLILGFGLGLPLNLGIIALPKSMHAMYAGLIEGVFGFILAIGYAVLLAVLAEKFRGKIWTPLASVGRMALSNYLIQSILCCTIFYSWGFAKFGKVTQWETLYIVLGVWNFNVVFSMVWLSKYNLGPFEWAWRSIVAKEKLSLDGKPRTGATREPQLR